MKKDREQEIKNKVTEMAQFLGGTFNISKRGVPYILVEGTYFKFSICWFGKGRFWRLFYPWGETNQIKENFKAYQKEEIKARLAILKNKKDIK